MLIIWSDTNKHQTSLTMVGCQISLFSVTLNDWEWGAVVSILKLPV